MARIISHGEPTPGRTHDCGDELRLLGDHHAPGTVAQCSCGAYFTCRPTSFWQDLLGVGPGNYVTGGFYYWAPTGSTTFDCPPGA